MGLRKFLEKNSDKNWLPWLWVPTLYFAEGIPYFLVNNITVIMFSKMGVPNGQLAFFTTLLYFPWFLKGLWSPLIDVIKTKRWWVLTMQTLLVAAMILITLTLPKPSADLIAAKETPVTMFWLTLVLFIVAAFASATHDIAADGYYMLAHSQSSQSAFIGIRSVFYRISSIFGQGVLVYIAGVVENSTREASPDGVADIPLSWQVSIGVAAGVFAIINLYHIFFLPKAKADVPRVQDPGTGNLKEMGKSFVSFFRKKGVWLAIAFMLIYRLPEGFLIKLCQPFLVDSPDAGGLGLDTDTVGIVYGTVGILALVAGGIIGGIVASVIGLKKSLWWMALGITLPSFAFVYLASELPANHVVISIALAVDQFGYGFGFTAYLLYMMYFSEGEFKTSHYAICTAFMALSMMLPGFVAGFIQEAIGYVAFFWMVMVCCFGTLAVTYLAERKVDPEYGKKK